MHVLIVEARFYDDLLDELQKGAKAALERAGATCEVVTVPGALEIPGAIAMAAGTGKRVVNILIDDIKLVGERLGWKLLQQINSPNWNRDSTILLPRSLNFQSQRRRMLTSSRTAI